MSKKILALATSLLTLVVLCGAPAAAFANDGVINKDETVYMITDSQGNQDKVIVSDHLKNDYQIQKISDRSDLRDIENVKGDEKFTKKGSSLEWEADGNDIYYQGKTDKEVPVLMNVTYKLNGKEITGPELQGKSGDVEILIKFTNNGKYKGKTVPFFVLTGMLIQDDCFTDVKINNGKIIDDGEKVVVAGLAAPGLAQSLDLGDHELSISDEVRITGTADKFAVKDILTMVTNSVFEEIDTGSLGDLNYDDEINQLNKGAVKLEDGSKQLYKGLDKMAEKAPALKDGTSKLKKGAADLKTGTDKTKAGSIALKDGVGTIGSKLNASMSQMCEALAKIAEGAKTLQSGQETMKDSLSKLKAGADSANGGVNKVETALTGESNPNSADALTKGAAAQSGKAAEDIKAIKEALDKIDKDSLSQEDQKALEEAMNKLGTVGTEVGTAKAYSEGASQTIEGASDGVKSIGAFTSAASEGLKSAIDAFGSADEPGNTLIYGSASIKAGSEQIIGQIKESTTTGDLAKGLKKLNKGTNDLVNGEKLVNSGAGKLAQGTAQLDAKTGTLVDGVNELDEGSRQLSDGMKELYKKGIKKIVDLYNNDLKGMAQGLNDMMDAGKGYKSFTKLPDDMDGSVKFIYKTTIDK